MNSRINWQWRPATENDIGRLARFFDPCDIAFESSCKGCLLDVDLQIDGKKVYHCLRIDGLVMSFFSCEVKCEASKEPL